MNQEKMEQVARLAAEIEDHIENRILWKVRAREIAALIEADEVGTVQKMQQLVFAEQAERKKQGARELARLLYCILVYVCEMSEQQALAFCSFIDGGEGGGVRPTCFSLG